MNKVEKGCTVSVDYTGKFDDGTVFDTSEGKAPLEFKAGEGFVIKGFDEAIIGMKKGEKKSIKVAPADAYGERNEKFIQKAPKSAFPPSDELKEGVHLRLKGPEGQTILAKVTKITDEEVTVDFNHPLAGKHLNFDITIVDVKKE